MKIKLITIIATISIFSNTYAQLDDNIKAKLYFTEAQKLFEQGDFENSLLYVDKAERAYGSMVARTLALKIKLEYNLGNFITAKKLFDTYTTYYMEGASKELNDEVLGLFVNIEEAAKAEKHRQLEIERYSEERRKAEEARKIEEVRKVEEERLAEERRKAEIAKLESEAYSIIVNGKILKIYPIDLYPMYPKRWGDANVICKTLGSGGWRLPSKQELKEMYIQLHKKGKGDFRINNSYWSSTEYESKTYGVSLAWAFSFNYGSGDAYNQLSRCYVRPVRDF